MEERDWIILVKLFEEKSITKAAEALFISQPALTSRLQYIEDRFRAQIVVRSKKGIHFTPEGEFLVSCAKKMIQKMHFIEGTIQTIRNEVKGTLRIGTSILFFRHYLPDLLKQFMDLYPNVDFKITTNLSGKIVDLVYTGDVDIGFIRGDYEWPEKQDLLFEENMYIVSHQDFSLKDLPSMPRIDYRSNNKTMRDSLNKWWKENFFTAPFIAVEVDKVDSCKELVSKGLGYAFLPEGILYDTDQVNKIVMLDKCGKPLVRRTWMLYHEDNLKIALVKTFVEFVNKSFACYI